MAAMSEELEWTEIGNALHAYQDKAHYVVYPRSDGKCGVLIFSMLTDKPDQVDKEKLGEYEATTPEDGKQIAQALADQRGWTW